MAKVLSLIVASSTLALVQARAGHTEPNTVAACGDSDIYELSEDYAASGPWAVGSHNLQLAGLNTEIWYPAQWNSEMHSAPHIYDVRQWLPEHMQADVSDDKAPRQTCDCYENLPIDTVHGPYPVMVFIHGTAGFRTQSLTFATHWASRGFVVVAADHPGLYLGDMLSFKLNQNIPKNVRDMIDALKQNGPELDFLEDRMDVTRMAISGHSAGGMRLAGLGEIEGVRVLIPLAAGGTDANEYLESSLILGAAEDGVVDHKNQVDGYRTSPVAKRTVSLANAGHLAFSDLCAVGADQGGLVQIAIDIGLPVPPAFMPMVNKLGTDGCGADSLAPEKGWEIVNFATSAVLEETLMCDTGAADAIRQIGSIYPDVDYYAEQLQ